MLKFILQLISLFIGRPIATPEEYEQLRHKADHEANKASALDRLLTEVKTEMHSQQIRHEESIRTQTEAHAKALHLKDLDLQAIKASFEQLNSSVDRETLRQLSENEQLINQLTWLSGTIAHDFRAPLRAIDAYSFFLADDLGENIPEEAKKSLSEIKRNGQRMGVLIDGLLEYLRIGVCPMTPQTLDMEELIQTTVNTHFDFSPVPITVNVSCSFRGDRELMLRALKELIDNAVKFSKPVDQPRVFITQTSPTDIEIIDNGVGFSADHTGQKFQLFHRMHGNDEFPGEGIGLCLAQRICARHHITLTLNRVGERTVASLRLS